MCVCWNVYNVIIAFGNYCHKEYIQTAQKRDLKNNIFENDE